MIDQQRWWSAVSEDRNSFTARDGLEVHGAALAVRTASEDRNKERAAKILGCAKAALVVRV